MPAIRQQNSYGAVGAGLEWTQALRIQSQLLSTMITAGWVIIRQSEDNNAWILRAPPLDSYYSHADLVFLWGASDPITVSQKNPAAEAVQDIDVQDPVYNHYSDPFGSPGLTYTPGPWPTGVPRRGGISASGATYYLLSPSIAGFTVTTYASEYGAIAIYDNGSGPANIAVAYLARPIGSYRHRRELTISTQNPNFPVTFLSPIGASHVTFNIDGNSYPVTFPVSLALNSSRVAQEITLQTSGHVEASVIENAVTTDILIEVPYDVEPAFGSSTTTPSLALTYIDSTADKLNLAIYTGGANSVSMSSIVVSSVNWVLFGVRIGATIYNRTRAQLTTVTGFATTGTTYDTLLASVPGTWLPTDILIVMPGPETHPNGLGFHNASYQAYGPSSSVLTFADGVVTLTLNDKLGEAQGHYQVGQSVIVASNGCAVTMLMASTAGYVRGDTVTDSFTTSTGIIREIYSGTSELTVDTVSGPTTATPAWHNAATLTGSRGGSSTITSVRSSGSGSDNTLGWYQRVPITAIGQVNVATGDYRTTLTMDFSGMNTAARFSPGMVVHVMGKMMAGTMFGDGATMTPTVLANISTQAFTIAADIAQDDNQLNTTASPRWDPDYETGSIPLCELVMRHASPFGADIAFTLPHIRLVNARTAISGDDFLENGDSNRRWRSYGSGSPFGATVWSAMMNGATTVLLCVGPGAL